MFSVFLACLLLILAFFEMFVLSATVGFLIIVVSLYLCILLLRSFLLLLIFVEVHKLLQHWSCNSCQSPPHRPMKGVWRLGETRAVSFPRPTLLSVEFLSWSFLFCTGFFGKPYWRSSGSFATNISNSQHAKHAMFTRWFLASLLKIASLIAEFSTTSFLPSWFCRVSFSEISPTTDASENIYTVWIIVKFLLF